ncbi:MAG: helix-turn-helix transcriptional regulator [Acutalibacteraceae bacterium]|nr:helix-turn-helix transcriptional regulator [Acutalibacteraceae bacterium]
MSKSTKKDIKVTIGQRINKLLAEKDVMQKELADHLGIQHNTISYYLKGERVPDHEKLVAIAEYFNVSTDYLLGRTETKTVEEDIQMICDYTGLNEDAVKCLHECCYTENTKTILSYLIAPKSKSRFLNDLINVSACLAIYKEEYLEMVCKLSSVESQIDTLSEKEIESILDDVEIMMKSAKLSYYDAVEHFRLLVDDFNGRNVKTPENEALVMDCIVELNTRLEEYYNGNNS